MHKAPKTPVWYLLEIQCVWEVALNCKEMGFPTVEFPTNEWEAMASEGDLIDVLGFNGTFSK